MSSGIIRKASIGLVLLVLAGALAGYLGWRDYQTFLATPLQIESGGEVMRVQRGDSIMAALGSLERRGITRSDWHWRALLRLEPTTIQTGEYALTPGLTPRGLLELLSSGAVIQYRFTLVEGWSYRQLRDALLADEQLAVAPELLETDRVMQELGRDLDHPEGWFLPETYAYTASDDAMDVLARALEAMEIALTDAWENRGDDLPFSDPYELLTMASIVEKESSIGPERSRVAGVFVRRLEQNWRLETDPTVIYGMGESYDGDIRKKDLRTPTPYNTYVIRGLPPTPIAMPGADALMATAQPADETAMFFVADGTGGHVFSTTLEEHNQAVQDYLRWLRNRDKMPNTTQKNDS